MSQVSLLSCTFFPSLFRFFSLFLLLSFSLQRILVGKVYYALWRVYVKIRLKISFKNTNIYASHVPAPQLILFPTALIYWRVEYIAYNIRVNCSIGEPFTKTVINFPFCRIIFFPANLIWPSALSYLIFFPKKPL